MSKINKIGPSFKVRPSTQFLPISRCTTICRQGLIAFSLPLLAILIIGSIAFADTQTSDSTATLTMQGQAAMVSGNLNSQLRLKTSSSDNSGWLLEVSLDPVNLRSNNGASQVWNVNGSFTLGLAENPLATGTATGWVGSGGTGDVVLAGGGNSTSLDMSFNIGDNGLVTATVKGQWPVPPPAQSQSASVPVQPNNHFFWYLSRVAALLAYFLLCLNIFLGLGLKTRFLDRLAQRWRTLDLHRFTAILVLGLVLLHIFSLLGDQYFSFTLNSLFIPGTSPYRPLWTALGTLSFYILLVIVISGIIRSRINKAVWTVIHYTSYVLFFLILYHGLKAGTDSSVNWLQWLYILTGTGAVFLFLIRFVPGARAADEARIK
ncbi:MAG TPA: ferric reductase-like transmembrane domain-containing protein [Dehalococcoidales bacterium]